MSKYISVKEFSKAYNVHCMTVHKWIKENKIKSIKKGNRIYIDVDSVK